jgi:hypothetical protein
MGPSPLAVVQRTLRHACWPLRGDGRHLPFADATFDAAWAMEGSTRDAITAARPVSVNGDLSQSGETSAEGI